MLDKDLIHTLYTAFILATTIMLVYVTIAATRTRTEKGAEVRIVTVARCPNCGYEVRRPFREGDYVGKLLDEKCPKCGAQMIVEEIYAEGPTELPSAQLLQKRKTQRRKTPNPKA
jgi:predicted RNA-binding Zn-ribbon protein involved in translation (DUF1610 family)